MKKILKVELENCFGIGELSKEFVFTPRERAQLIYAPNGTMKSSFANVFYYISKDKVGDIKDRIFLEKTSKCTIELDDASLTKEMILVVNAETKISEQSITKFIARSELKSRYDEIFTELGEEKSKFIAVLKRHSRSSDCEGELQIVFENQENFFDYLVRVENLLNDNYPKYSFKYNDIFDKGDKVKKFLELHESLLEEYLKRYTELITKSKFFSSSGNSFGTLQASNLLDSLNDNAFFDAGHKISLQSDETINSKEELEGLIQSEKDQILNDTQLLKSFEKVDKALAKNADLKIFKRLLESDTSLLIELSDFEGFRKKIWLSHISEMKSEVGQVLNIYKSRKTELQEIINRANSDIDKWKDTIELFNSRFYVPFTIMLENRSDVILKSDIPKLKFLYKDRDIPENSEGILLDVLSRGESRAYYILRFLFEIESRLIGNQDLLLIFDDVADSFDYKNKYAIIEYIKDLLERANVNAIILTHNFDFYRTVAKRLFLKKSSFMATKCSQGTVEIKQGKYFEDVFKSIFVKNYHYKKNFIGLIPFVRNLFEYLSNDAEYNFLTSCLHIKSNTQNITVQDVHNSLIVALPEKNNVILEFSNQKLIDIIFDEANSIQTAVNQHSSDLEDKLLIAIACRLKAELYMISHLNNDEKIELNTVSENQTQHLYQLCKSKGIEINALKVLNRVNLMTPEHIHINSFMFEPLVDMSMNHLVGLYGELTNLVLNTES